MSRTADYQIERPLTGSRLAQYVTRNRCERYLRFALFPSEAAALRGRYHVGSEVMSPVLSDSGKTFERDKVEELRRAAPVRDLVNRPPDEFIAAVRAQAAGRTFYDQAALAGRIGAWACGGITDLVRVTRHEDGALDALIIDLKSSRRETVGFRLQVAFYARLLADMLGAAGLTVRTVAGAIAARHNVFTADEIAAFDLAIYLDEIERLVAAPDSDVAHVALSAPGAAHYHLGPHCNGCPHNQVCFIETAETRGLSLVPLLTASEKNALEAAGVGSARDLAGLMAYDGNALRPAPGREDDARRVASRWPLGSRLPALVQRARAALKRQDAGVEARSYMLGADFGSLPDEQAHLGLVKVFVDAQRDHIEDRLYLIACLIAGPAGEVEIVEMTDAPPDDDTERGLLIRWLQRALPAIRQAAGAASAPLHVYLYDRGGQRALLDALARHFDALCALPAFYDLLTSTPALTQAVVSFLDDEVRERKNLGQVCPNLYQTAGALGFKWRDGGRDFRQLFRAAIFDNRRAYRRDPATGRFTTDGDGPPLWVESAARFGTQIPLEYAYAAWGRLGQPPGSAEARAALQGFLGVTADDLRAFALQRCRALHYVEASFNLKNRYVEKQPLDLSRLDEVQVDPAQVPFHDALRDFLYLEHHARFQELLLHYALSPELRAATGRSALLRCESYHKDASRAETATFRIVNAAGRPLPADEAAALRLGEDGWVVLNPVADEAGEPVRAGKIKNGRLAAIEKVEAGRLRLRLLPMSFKGSRFRYGHGPLGKPLTEGALYTIDEMADDLNADKFLEACRHAPANHLYRWLVDPAEGKTPRPIRPQRLRLAAEVAALAAASQAPHGLTAAQHGVVGGLLAERVLVLQGPPGTGKSHTLGFAILARALALATPARPFRVAVAARTHAATLVALESVVKRRRDLLAAHPGDGRLAPLRDLKVAKITNDPGEPLPEGVEGVATGGNEELTAREQWEGLLNEPLLVIGGTPGGVYNLVKKGASSKNKIDWGREYFDLVVVDEASQMGLAEALTAAAFLRADGQFIAIGDHRQMPPILAHAWDQEARRDMRHAAPHLSVFDYLRRLEFPTAALDQSFRIPAEIADFLHRHIYREDGIAFHSRNRRRLDGMPGLSGWVAAALAPEHPLVVIEHDEAASQRENSFEAALVEELVRAATGQLGLDGREGVGVVVPHRAQKFLLRGRLPEVADAIDTVERFQGGERDLMIVSATVSDREFAMLESGFLLEPRRLTVAISRPKRKLVVISSRAVFDLIPGDLDEYERGALWKYLRHECGGPPLWEGEVRGHRVCVRAAGTAR